MMRVHFVGIGGIGMSGIAEVLINQGYSVSGSDLGENDLTARLTQMGAKIFKGHRTENVSDARVVVISSAVKADNPEVVEAKRRKIPVIPRAEMLAEVMRGKTGIAVAGTHGKTTTTTLIAGILSHAKLDPTIIVGGKVDSLGSNAKLGQGKFMVAEADESDGSFLHLPFTYGVVTNIDNDHLDYYGSIQAVDDAFQSFIAKAPFYGVTAICGDDAGVQRIIMRATKPIVTYGLTAGQTYQAVDLEPHAQGWKFKVRWTHSSTQSQAIEIQSLGIHNVLNATAAFAICHQMGITPTTIAEGLTLFKGVRRRFDIRWRSVNGDQVIVDDYGHHPTEIAATLNAAKQFWPASRGRILCIFQPHRYSRTLHCRDGFLSAFKNVDQLWLTEIYAAGEDPVPGISGSSLADAIRAQLRETQSCHFVPTLTEAKEAILKEFRPGDLLLCMGAGTITQFPESIIGSLK